LYIGRVKNMMRNPIKIFVVLFVFSVLLYGCGGGGAGVADVPPGVNPGQVSLLKLMPDRNVAQTGSFAYFHARVLDGNGVPLSGKTVNFTNMTTGVTLTATTAITDRDGIAKVGARMTHSGYATVIAEAEGHRDRRSLLFTNQNSIRGYSLNPIIVLLQADRNMNGIYDEADDFKVCQGPNMSVVRVKATTYVMGVRQGGMRLGITADYPTLITFPNTPMLDQTTNTYYLTTNPMGEATVDITVNCQLQPNELLFNIFATTDIYYIEDFDLSFIGTGGMSLFLQPVTVTGILLTADPTTAMVGGTSQIRATVNTTIGPAPDNTAVQLYTTCGTISPTPALTLNGVAEAVYTAPSYIPQGNKCTVIAKVANKEATVDINITGQLDVQPSTLTIDGNQGGTATFTVTGGIPGYRIYSNDAAFSPNPATLQRSGDSFTVNVPAGTPATTVTFTIIDSQGNRVTATLNITSTQTALTITPGAVTLAPGESAQFMINGGRAPYSITSSRPDLLTLSTSTVSSSGGTFRVTAGTVTATTTVTVVVRDSLGAIATATVTINPGTTTLAVNPTAATIGASETAVFTITGGRAPYTVTSSRPTIAFNSTPGNGTWIVTQAGGTFTVTGGVVSAATAVVFTITDANGASITQPTVTVNPGGGATFAVSPNNVTLTGTAGTDDRVTFTINGGVGPFSVLTSNAPVIPAPSVSGRTFTINPNPVGANTAVTLTVVDLSNGNTVTATVTVTPQTTNFAINPSTITMTSGTFTNFYIIGGNGPFTVVSGNSAVVTVDGQGVVNLGSGVRTFRVDAIMASGTDVTITVIDTTGGARATSTVTVN
jgi:hypothetical protein